MHRTGLAILLTVAASSPTFAQTIRIDHAGAGCLVAEKFPRMVACFSPASRLARARVYFRARGSESWYWVDMKADAPCHFGILPRPMRSTTGIDYYVEAIDTGSANSRTPQFAPTVVSEAE